MAKKIRKVLEIIKTMVKEPIDKFGSDNNKNVVNFVIWGYTEEEILSVVEKIKRLCGDNFTYTLSKDNVYKDDKYYFEGHIQVDKNCSVDEIITNFNKKNFVYGVSEIVYE